MSNDCCRKRSFRHCRSTRTIGVYVSGLLFWTCGCVFFAKEAGDDLDAVQTQVASLRSDQRVYEPQFLQEAEERQDSAPAWELISAYHLAKAAEILGMYQSQGSVRRALRHPAAT